MNKSGLNIFQQSQDNRYEIPLSSDKVKAGFPSPANDFMDSRISLDRELVKNKNATFYAKVEGDSMENANIHDGDLLVIDRSIEPANNKIAVCFIDGEFTVKRLQIKEDAIYLQPESSNYEAIKVTEENQFLIWGIVTYVVKEV